MAAGVCVRVRQNPSFYLGALVSNELADLDELRAFTLHPPDRQGAAADVEHVSGFVIVKKLAEYGLRLCGRGHCGDSIYGHRHQQ